MNTSIKSSTLNRLQALLQASKKDGSSSEVPPKDSNAQSSNLSSSNTIISVSSTPPNNLAGVDRSTGKSISYNEEQLQFISLMAGGESAVLIGAAGTGKTTCQRSGIQELIQSGHAGILPPDLEHKHLCAGTPGIVVCAYTRRAVSNIRKAVSEDMKRNCITIHKLLEYAPEKIEVEDPTTGEWKTSQIFVPTRNAINPLPSSIRTVIIEEASMVSVELFQELLDALPHKVQFIFLGDIQQLPPVFGSAILGFKMLELPVVELRTVYRQALESPIIRLAHRILSGKCIPSNELDSWKVPNKLTLHPWKKELSADNALLTLAKFLKVAEENGVYDPEEDMILMPFNKSCGTIELNKHIAQHLARKRKALVYEVIAGWDKVYLSVGDKVLVDKEDGIILEITPNPSYAGVSPQPPHQMLDYWGYNESTGGDSQHHISDEDSSAFMDEELLLSAAVSAGEEAKKQASHILKVKLLESEAVVELKSAGDLNGILLAFALTVHKSQGSEFRKVFLLLHKSHATMLSRELLYTAVTRAKEELYVICEPTSFVSGISSQRIKGNTLAEKSIYFQGKANEKARRLT